jgi:hypothetical protein
MPDFQSRDPLSPAFWDERFDKDFTPWDRGGAPERLARYVAGWQGRAPVALIPGCGSAYELALMCEAGWDATAIDFSASAVAQGKAAVGRWAERVLEADFFAYAPPKPLDLIYERAFLCAMPPAMWPSVAARWAALLPSGGLLAGYFFCADTVKGPPFGIPREELDKLLAPAFTLTAEEPVTDSLPVFAGRELWLEWRRR